MNVLIIVFSFIFLTPHSMLNNDQAQAIQETYQSYQALVAHCKQHNLDINTILSPAQKKQLKGGMEFLKTWMPEVMKVMDIPKIGFAPIVKSCINNLLSAIQAVANQDNLKAVQLSEDKIENLTNLFTSAVEHPLMQKIKEIIGASLEESAANNLNFPEAAKALSTKLAGFSPEEINAYFKGNIYGGKRYSEQGIEKLFPKSNLVANAFEKLADTQDPDHPDNIAAKKAAKKAKKAAKKEEEAEAIKQFTIQFSEWVKDQISDLNTKLDSADRDFQLRLVDENLLKKNLSKMKSPKYATDYWYAIAGEISAKVAEIGMPSLADIKDFAEQTLNNKSNDVVIKKLAEKAIINKEANVFPFGLTDWLDSSVRDTSYQVVKDSLKEWAEGDVVNAIDKFIRKECKNKPSQKMDKEKVLLNFEHILSRATPTGAQPGKAVYSEFKKNIPGTDVFSAAELKEAWKTTVLNSKSNDAAKAMFEQLLVDIPNWDKLEKTMGEITTTLPSKDEVVTACKQSKWIRPSATSSVPKLENGLNIIFDIKNKFRPALQNISITVGVPLRYVTYKTENWSEYYMAVPKQEITIVNQGGKGYKFPSSPKQVIVHPFHFDENSYSATCITSVTLVFPVEDTAKYTVIKEAENSSIGFNLDASIIPGLADILGKDNAEGLLGGGINIVGNDYGNVGEIKGYVTLFGFKLGLAVGKDGIYGFCDNPLELKSAITQYGTGGQNFDLYLTFEVHSALVIKNSTQEIMTKNGKVGDINGNYKDNGGATCSFTSGTIYRMVHKVKE